MKALVVYSVNRANAPRMYGQERIIVANLDKREFIAMDSPTKLLASTSHLPADGRGAKHDTYCISEKNAVSQYKTFMGYMAMIGPRDEMTDLISDNTIPNRSRYGSWYGDRIITYGGNNTTYYGSGTSGNNPFRTATNNFTEITNVALEMGNSLFTHYKLIK